MNERIKEIARVAGGHPGGPASRGTVFRLDPSYIDPTTVDLTKFAELIIKECMVKVCEELDNSYSEDGKEIINDRVLKHFGVEK